MTTVHATVSGHPFDLTHDQVERALRGFQPEALQAHYVVVGGRRFPPKQVLAIVTGLDRSAFISTQARRILERLGFAVGRVGIAPGVVEPSRAAPSSVEDERLSREAELLRHYVGQFVAIDPEWSEVVASGPDARSVSRALAAIGREGVVFRVPLDPAQDVGGFGW